MYSWQKLLVSVLFVIQFTNAHEIETIHQWKQLDFGFPTAADEQEAINSGNLIVANNIAIEVAAHYLSNGTRRVFVSTPVFSSGVPYTFATVSSSGKLQPYPDYSWHKSHGQDCDGITSTYRVAFTPCNQMWLIDYGGGPKKCAPQLLLFNLLTDKLEHRFRFPENLYVPGGSSFITPAVKVNDPAPHGTCRNTTVYVADTGFHGIVVYDYAQNVAWRAENRFMYPDPEKGEITLAGDQFVLMDGIFGMSVDQNYLYFNPLASQKLYRVPLSILNDRVAYQKSKKAYPKEYKELGSRGNGCTVSAIDSRNNIYCVGFNPVSLLRWNTATRYNKSNIRTLSREEEILQFASGIKVIKNHQGKEELWMLTNRYQKYANGATNPSEINYRILKRNLN